MANGKLMKVIPCEEKSGSFSHVERVTFKLTCPRDNLDYWKFRR